MNDRDIIDRLRPFCRAWGGDLIEVTPFQFKRLFNYRLTGEFGENAHSFEEAPAADFHGVVYELKHVYVVPWYATANGLIHEMGHVFASELPPDDCDEMSFLGWEAVLALTVGAYRDWSRLNDSYGLGGVGGLDEWGTASAKGKAQVLRECIEVGACAGIITPDWKPRPLR